MTEENALTKLDDSTMLSLAVGGDCTRLTDPQKLQYLKARCDAAGLDPRAQPFAFLQLNGKLVLYALKAATDQLAARHGIIVEVVAQSTDGDCRVVTVRAKTRDGRATDEIGAVDVAGMKGANLCNAMMKAVTKAKRRAILSLCGLGMMDETELDTVAAARPQPPPALGFPPTDSRAKIIEAERAAEAAPAPDTAPADWLRPATFKGNGHITDEQGRVIADLCDKAGISGAELKRFLEAASVGKVFGSVADVTKPGYQKLHGLLTAVTEGGKYFFQADPQGRFDPNGVPSFIDVSPASTEEAKKSAAATAAIPF